MKKKNEIIEEVSVTPEVETEVEPVVEGSIVVGVIANCAKLNVRENANKEANVVCIVNKDTKVNIDLDASTEDFYRVFVDGKEGYCIKQFVNID